MHTLRTGSILKPDTIRAVDGISVQVRRGEVIGIVGESGSGKTTLGRLLVRLLEPTSGGIQFDGTEISHLSEAALRPLRARIQMIFQDPFASLNPRRKVGRIIADGMVARGTPLDTALKRAQELLAMVGPGMMLWAPR
ncbi:MAG: ATP-binding cassette domain-containing protein, partial [Dermabacter sp.]|nr:ATP-binding cassette domain-containing protein [Dermabacter sp.]